MKANNILETIGNTTHLRLKNLFPNHNVWLKLEKENPGGSIKDRIALAMIEDAERNGILNKESTIIEPTSGNTGIGLAMVAAVKKYKLILVMPESMSVERRKIMAAYGAEFVLTSKERGMKGSIEKANELLKEIPNAWMPMQFNNESNPNIHKRTTALEIINDFQEGVDYLITGVGSAGHITGVGEVLKSQFKDLQVMAVEPESSAVISGEMAGPHKIQGIGAGFIPENLNVKVIDETIKVSNEEAFLATNELVRKEALFAGISTGASIAAIQKVLHRIPQGKTIISFSYDGGEKYLSAEGLFSYE